MRVPVVCVLVSLCIQIAISSCGGGDSRTRALVTELSGREIELPDSLEWQIRDKRIDIKNDFPDFTIITYIDSGGCTPCHMKLLPWDSFLSELKAVPDVEVGFRMIVHSSDTFTVQEALDKVGSNLPVAIDSIDLFRRLNALPDDRMCHTLLLDAENQICAIGNPVLNPKIGDLYRTIISAGTEADNNIAKAQSIGAVAVGDTIRLSMPIVNTDSISLTIEKLVPSCPCVSATVPVQKLERGDIVTVDIDFVADSSEGSFSRYVDVYFYEKQQPQRLLFYGYSIN